MAPNSPLGEHLLRDVCGTSVHWHSVCYLLMQSLGRIVTWLTLRYNTTYITVHKSCSNKIALQNKIVVYLKLWDRVGFLESKDLYREMCFNLKYEENRAFRNTLRYNALFCKACGLNGVYEFITRMFTNRSTSRLSALFEWIEKNIQNCYRFF